MFFCLPMNFVFLFSLFNNFSLHIYKFPSFPFRENSDNFSLKRKPLFSSAQGSDQKRAEGDKWRVKMLKQSKTEEGESQPSINLDLGIGGPTTAITSRTDYHQRVENNPAVSSRGVIVKVEPDEDHDDHDQMVEREKQGRCRKCSVVWFTEEQLEEFKAQIVIFKCMVSGLPVPLQLLLPIWRCFSSSSSSSLSSLYCGIHTRNPYLLRSWGCKNQYSMDPEPGRCKRTDGKKWRCHNAVVPNEKYCERHMHRGSKRSRKLVEGSTQQPQQQPNINPGPLNTNPNDNNVPQNSAAKASTGTNSNDLKVKFPASLAQKPQLFALHNPISSSCSSNSGTVGATEEPKNCPTPRVLIKVPSLGNSTKIDENNEHGNSGKHNGVMNERIAAISLSSGLDFSPKSVLGGQNCTRAEIPKNDPNGEPGRCRRTDGKKWRCYKNVLPDQKYCAHHIYRGYKRPAPAVPLSNASSGGVKFFGTELPKASTNPNNTSLNVPLTMSSSDPRHSTPENEDTSSTSETTVTDNSADVLDKIAFSP